jgi:glycolate oxidase FAD binding subunit
MFGRRALRYGTIKDTIVGVEIVRPDGTRARGGGKVVKNVAGFDMPKLMVGSLGTLGAVISATFRVYPIEEQHAAVAYRGVDLGKIMQICNQLVAEQLVPASVLAYESRDPKRYDCVVSFEGFSRGVEQQVKAATSIAFRLGVSAGAFAGSLIGSLYEREVAVRRGPAWRVTLSAAPTALAAFLAATEFAGIARLVYPMLGIAFLAADDLDAATIGRWRAALPAGSVVVNAMPQAARDVVETWGAPQPAALAIMRRLKANFDPKGLCNAGRFVGGL